jgi:hypothetical protein
MTEDAAEQSPRPTELPPEIDCIKLVRLVTGEDILCVLRDEPTDEMKPTDEITLSCPLKLILHRVTPLRPATEMAIGIIQWLPDELLDAHEVTIKVGHIITVMEPKHELKAYYKKTVDLIQVNIMKEDKNIRRGIAVASIDAARLIEQEQTQIDSKKAPGQHQHDEVLNAADVEINRLSHILQQLHDLEMYMTEQGMDRPSEDEGPLTFH